MPKRPASRADRDSVGAKPQAICQHAVFATRVSQAPLLTGRATTKVRLAGLLYVTKADLIDRVVYRAGFGSFGSACGAIHTIKDPLEFPAVALMDTVLSQLASERDLRPIRKPSTLPRGINSTLRSRPDPR